MSTAPGTGTPERRPHDAAVSHFTHKNYGNMWLKRHSRFVTIVAWSLAGLGCSSTQRAINTAELKSSYRVETYEKGRPVAERSIVPGSEDEQVINRWLQAHETGWQVDINTYAPGRRIKGDDFDLNFSGRVCVMNYFPMKGGQRVQVSRTLEKSERLPELFAVGR